MSQQKYYLFLDESGDHGLTNIDPNFPVFVLAGIIISSDNYAVLQTATNRLKNNLWPNKKVILHSRDIRKCEKEFSILFDLNIKKYFYEEINKIISNTQYQIISSAVNKGKYVKKYGKLQDDVYEIALSFILERTIFYLDSTKKKDINLEIIIEKRGKKEDKKLNTHFQILKSRGTSFVNSKRINEYGSVIKFCRKKDNIDGLQLSDLIAYPIARYVLDPNRTNPSFEIFKNKFYSKGDKIYGLKIFP